MGNEKIAGFNHSFVGLGNGKSGMNGQIERVKVFVKAVRIDGIQTGMIGLDVDQADMGMGCLGFFERAQGEAIECTVMTGEEFGDAVFGDVALNNREEVWIYVGGGIGVTKKETGFLRHKDHLND